MQISHHRFCIHNIYFSHVLFSCVIPFGSSEWIWPYKYNLIEKSSFMKHYKFLYASEFWTKDSKKTCRDLVLSDLMCYTCYLFEKIISPVFRSFLFSSVFSDLLSSNIDNKYSISSHLRQGLCTFFWSQKFEFLMYLKTCVCLEKNIIIWQTL